MDKETIQTFNQATYYFRSHEAENEQFQRYADAMDKMFETADKKEQETRNICAEKHCRIFACEKCGYGIDDIFLVNEKDYSIGPIFCPNCGRKVKWNA